MAALDAAAMARQREIQSGRHLDYVHSRAHAHGNIQERPVCCLGPSTVTSFTAGPLQIILYLDWVVAFSWFGRGGQAHRAMTDHGVIGRGKVLAEALQQDGRQQGMAGL